MAKYRHLMVQDEIGWHLMSPSNPWEALRIAWLLWRYPDRVAALVGVLNEYTLANWTPEQNGFIPPAPMPPVPRPPDPPLPNCDIDCHRVCQMSTHGFCERPAEARRRAAIARGMEAHRAETEGSEGPTARSATPTRPNQTPGEVA